MSATERLKALFGLTDSTDPDGLAVLQDLLAERQSRLSLEAEYGRPTVNMQGEPTAVFPISLYHDGDAYGAHSKEFPIPDNGLEDEGAPLTQFLHAHGISSIENLDQIQGETTSATLKDNGEVEVEF